MARVTVVATGLTSVLGEAKAAVSGAVALIHKKGSRKKHYGLVFATTKIALEGVLVDIDDQIESLGEARVNVGRVGFSPRSENDEASRIDRRLVLTSRIRAVVVSAAAAVGEIKVKGRARR